MMRTGSDVADLRTGHFFVKLGSPSPSRILPTIVCQHLFGSLILPGSAPEGLQNLSGFLSEIYPQPCNKAGIIVDKAYQIDRLFLPGKLTNIRLPHQMRPLHIRLPIFDFFWGSPDNGFLGGLYSLWQKRLLVQHIPNRFVTGLHEKKPIQKTGYPVRSKLWLRLLHLDNLFTDSRR